MKRIKRGGTLDGWCSTTVDKRLAKMHGGEGFISNRFGRIGELSSLVVKHINFIRGFFEKYVDKLVLAVFSYKKSS